MDKDLQVEFLCDEDKMTVLAEGDAQTRKDITYLEKLPLFDPEGNAIW